MLEKNCLDSDRSSSFVTNDIYKHLSCVFCSLINGFSAEMYTPIINLLMQTKTHKSTWNEGICLVIKLNHPLIWHLPDFLALSLWNFGKISPMTTEIPFWQHYTTHLSFFFAFNTKLQAMSDTAPPRILQQQKEVR